MDCCEKITVLFYVENEWCTPTNKMVKFTYKQPYDKIIKGNIRYLKMVDIFMND